MTERQHQEPKPTIIGDRFREYYKRIYVPGTLSEEEFEKMLDVYKIQLPTVFRVSSKGPEAEQVQSELDEYVKILKENNVDFETLDYIPNDIGKIYKLSLDKKALRRDKKFTEFHKWLKLHTNLGHCHRQEFVSMIPPFFLDVHGSMGVLDTCAAPGSKTTQLIEMLDGDGYVVANDADVKRLHPMVHQLQRVGTYRTLVINFDAQKLPDFEEKFDRVLCDVPCTGDGTIRKNIKCAETFKLNGGTSLHSTQRKILKRGLELTKVGGLCVYSTCSMNPIEDEAVVNSVLLETGDSVEIVDVSDKFPNLIRHKGLTNWPVFDAQMENEFHEYKEPSEVPHERIQYAHPTHFPQPQVPGLEHCMHFFPHDQDSGGFFVTVLRKVKELDRLTEQPSEKKPLREAAYIAMQEAAPDVLKFISDTYGFKENFPSDCVFVRDDNKVKNISLCVKPLADIIRKYGSIPLRVVSLGSRIFTYKGFGKEKENKAAYPALEGILDVIKYATKRVYKVTPEEMLLLLHSIPNALGYSRLSENTRNTFENSGIEGAIVMIDGTNYAYGGMTFEHSVVLYVRSDLVTVEVEKLKQSYPSLVEYEKVLEENDKKFKEEQKAKQAAAKKKEE